MTDFSRRPGSIHSAAPTSLSIKIVTAVVLVIEAGFLAACVFSDWAVIPAALLAIVILACYLRAPVGYEISPAGLTVIFRLGSKTFGPVTTAAPVRTGVGRSLRLWGNGGLFAGTGIFWNRAWGTFRAYVTSSDQSQLVLVATQTGKVLVSPMNVEEFIGKATRAPF